MNQLFYDMATTYWALKHALFVINYKVLTMHGKGKQRYLIMVIELSGVQFVLKSYAWFQNRTSAQQEFDLNSQVWFKTKIARPEVQLPLY